MNQKDLDSSGVVDEDDMVFLVEEILGQKPVTSLFHESIEGSRRKPLMKKSNLTRRLGAYSVAAGAAALGMASTAEAGLKVFDHRAATLYPIVDYWTWDQTLMVMNVKTGDFQYVVDDLGGTPTSISRYDQDGFVDNNAIPESAKTDDTVWFSHRDMNVQLYNAPKAADGVTLETPTGGVGGRLEPEGWGVAVYAPGRVDGSPPNTWVAHDFNFQQGGR